MIEQKINYQFKNQKLLEQALTHKSFQSHEQNERLEFLGDAIVDLILAEFLMELFPDQDEGRLSKKRAGLVNETSLASIATELELGGLLKLGKSEIQSEGSKKPRILAGCFEALVGALYLDGGFESTRRILRSIFESRVLSGDADQDFSTDYKTRLQEAVQSRQNETPTYQVVSEKVEGNHRTFAIQVLVSGAVLGFGQGGSKKAAEQEAAKQALQEIEKVP